MTAALEKWLPAAGWYPRTAALAEKLGRVPTTTVAARMMSELRDVVRAATAVAAKREVRVIERLLRGFARLRCARRHLIRQSPPD